ncbi:alpha-ketoglutarate-dependent dioxygenase AlkB [Polycladidibacter hongkongensis]|uniref:alpha-ketoglutarate-dependent dioxygenase AlkB n=1 Tax=Polycladidibacter hongkongensis TaxID=1647556 RepID=UPI000836B28D|nr:alpha-ketoglutarate-dependent dioxygenase AlkB [Pseudovibrio hongkongensis]
MAREFQWPQGLLHLPEYFDLEQQQRLLLEIRGIVAQAPLFQPVMPRSGRPFSVKMSNCGRLGWVSDRAGYRYQPTHPETGLAWPTIPQILLDLWREYAPDDLVAEACLINFYSMNAKMGLHQDRDEHDFRAPVISVSLGDSALFRVGGQSRSGATGSLKLQSGDVVVLGGEARTCFHGIDRIYAGSSRLLAQQGRLNLTIRHVGEPAPVIKR